MNKAKPSRSIDKTDWGSFHALNYCQFIGSMNDNLFKLLLVYCFIQIEGIAASNWLLSLAGAIYVLPFLLLATTAGTLSDRYAKQSIIFLTRSVEIVALLLGTISFWIGNLPLAFFSLFLLACHSALFGPSKYGIIPELVTKRDISKANGLLTLFTYTAIIVGTFLASFLTEMFNHNFIRSSIPPLLFSCSALIAAFKIRKTPAAGSRRKVSPLLLQELILTLRRIRKEPFLLSAVLGSAFFLFAGSFIQLNLIPFAIYSLGLTDVQGGYLFLLTALGIGLGSFLAGKFSGKAIEFGLIPIGGLGLALCFFLLHVWSDSLSYTIPLMFLIGVSGGLYLIPLDSYIQIASPPIYRGQIVATSNFFGFTGVLISALLLYCTSELFHLTPDQAFLLMGIIVLPMIALLSFSFSGFIIRFFAFLLSFFFSPSALKGKEMISLDHPSFFFVPRAFWPWAPILMASQRNRMRFYTTSSMKTMPLISRLLMKCVPVIQIQDVANLYPNQEEDEMLRYSIRRGCSIVLFTSKKAIHEHSGPLAAAWKTTKEGAMLEFFCVLLKERELDDLSAPPLATSLEAEIEKIP